MFSVNPAFLYECPCQGGPTSGSKDSIPNKNLKNYLEDNQRMTTTAQLEAVPTSVADIPLQPASQDIWETKYQLKTRDGTPVDDTIDATYQRVARALADVEATLYCVSCGTRNLYGHCGMVPFRPDA